MSISEVYNKIHLWRKANIKERHFLLFACFIVGILTALAAYLLKLSIHFVELFLTNNFSQTDANYLYLVYPIIGILLAGLFVKYWVKDDISHGVTKILFSISQRKSRIKPHNMYTSLVASSITIGFGGSVGAEAPIVLTGSAIGSNVGRFFKLDQRNLMLLVGCGAAGAIAGIFKAPIAGILFVIEVLLLDLTLSSILPLLVTAVTATTISYILTGTDAMFAYSQVEAFTLQRIPYVILLGIICGFLSLYVTRTMSWSEDVYSRLKPWTRFALGGITLSILIFLFPPLFGEGYNSIETLLAGGHAFNELLNGSFFYNAQSRWGIVVFLGLILFFKTFATSARSEEHTSELQYFGFYLFLYAERAGRGDLSSAGKFCADGDGRGDGRSNACTADRDVPHRRTYRRVRAVPAVDDCLHLFLCDHCGFRKTQYLCNAPGKKRRTDHAPQR